MAIYWLQVLDAVLKEICSALLESDVNVLLVGNLRKSVKAKVKVDELAAGVNKKRIIQKVRISTEALPHANI